MLWAENQVFRIAGGAQQFRTPLAGGDEPVHGADPAEVQVNVVNINQRGRPI